MYSVCIAGVERPSYSEYCTNRGTFCFYSVCTQTHVNKERSETHLLTKSIPDKRTNRGIKDLVVRQNVFIKNLHINTLPALFWSRSRFSCHHQKCLQQELYYLSMRSDSSLRIVCDIIHLM